MTEAPSFITGTVPPNTNQKDKTQMEFSSFVFTLCLAILVTIINFYFLRAIIISGIKEAFKQMEEAKAPANAPAEVKPTRTDNTLVTKSGLVFERKTQQD
jgi:hypothetical protein